MSVGINAYEHQANGAWIWKRESLPTGGAGRNAMPLDDGIVLRTSLVRSINRIVSFALQEIKQLKASLQIL